MLRILGKSSSINVRKVLWACDELDLPFAHEQCGSRPGDLTSAGFKALNPNALVPVLCDGDFVLWESNSILRYLANRHGGGALYPHEARARARVDQWLDWQVSELNRAWSYAFQAIVRQSPTHSDPREVQASLDAWTRCMSILDERLAQTGAYVAGAEFSLADIAIGLSIDRWFETPFARPRVAAVESYCRRLAARRGFARYCTSSPL